MNDIPKKNATLRSSTPVGVPDVAGLPPAPVLPATPEPLRLRP